MRNKSNIKTSDERTISQKLHDLDLKWAKIFLLEAKNPIDKQVWGNWVTELDKRIVMN